MNRYSKKVLIIDDSEDILILMKEILKALKYEILCCTSARKALEIVDETVDLIILDIMMPDLSGKDFLRIFRSNENFSKIPILVCTAMNKSSGEIDDLFGLGINDYINKPFIKQELIARVKVQVDNKILKENLIKSNEDLKKELDKNRELLKMSMGYASELENNLINKLNEAESKNNDETILSGIAFLKSQLDKYKEEKERLIEENQRCNQKVEDMNNIFSTIVMHDTIIEDELSTKLDEATVSAITDPLTKIFNRNKMNESLEKEINIANKYNKNLSLIMFDIDHFKNINDAFGHDIGDVVLKNITSIVTSGLRENSIFARWGGEEFLILLPELSLKKAYAVAERLRKIIQEFNFKEVKSVTCSFGVTQYIPGENSESFLKSVDNCLYNAKRSGRNCVKIESGMQ